MGERPIAPLKWDGAFPPEGDEPAGDAPEFLWQWVPVCGVVAGVGSFEMGVIGNSSSGAMQLVMSSSSEALTTKCHSWKYSVLSDTGLLARSSSPPAASPPAVRRRLQHRCRTPCNRKRPSDNCTAVPIISSTAFSGGGCPSTFTCPANGIHATRAPPGATPLGRNSSRDLPALASRFNVCMPSPFSWKPATQGWVSNSCTVGVQTGEKMRSRRLLGPAGSCCRRRQ
mmetsp:Transcript_129114/g.373693  ORF Transcript_129114/g.373693 Transcript_129114/m.373693 type:complete len:227 (-) Transcript_129114:2497-3177(-)